MKKENVILDLSLDFSVNVVRLCEKLNEFPKDVIAKQLIRSGTSIGANIWEAQGAESKKDFVHKLKISAKEGEETHFWLELCKRLNYVEGNELLEELIVIKKILSKIISTSKNSMA